MGSNFEIGLQFVLRPREWQYLLRFERVIGEGEFQFYASYHSDTRELFTGCFTSPVRLDQRQGSAIFASVTVSGLPVGGFDAANDEAYLDAFEGFGNDVCRFDHEVRDLT